jgi:hypothetical protein
MVFMPDTGAVTRVHTNGGEQTSVTIAGASVQARRYQINLADGREQYEVWMDERRTPVMFNIVDSDGTTTLHWLSEIPGRAAVKMSGLVSASFALKRGLWYWP